MKKETQIIKINKDIVEKLRNQNPGQSINEIVGWAFFELKCIEKHAKDLKIPVELYKEANIFTSEISKIKNIKILNLVEVMKTEHENIKFDDAMKIFDEEEI